MIRKLSNNQIDIWQADLNENRLFQLSSYFYILNQEEKENASNFKETYQKKYYILSHVILRLLLSKYTGVDPALIEIHKNKYGKPFITSHNLQFNISHSKNKLAIAIAVCEVGIDIEYVNPNFDINEILNVTLSINEELNIKKLKPNLQKKQFYLYWTKKEALLKAIGTGINMDLNKLEISDDSSINIDKEKEWIIVPFNSFDKNYIGNIVFKGKNNKVIQYYSCNELCLYPNK